MMPTTGPESIDELFKAAINHQAAGRLVDAEAFYRQILRAQPSHSTVAAHLVNLLGQTGRHEEGMALARQLLERTPTEPAALRTLANAARMGGRYEEAVRALQTAISLVPQDDVSFRDLGLTLTTMGQLEQGIAAYQRAIELRAQWNADQQSPNERLIGSQIWLNLGVALHSLNRIPEAIAAHRRAIELQPEYAKAHMNLGFLYFRQGDFLRAYPEYAWRFKAEDFVDPWPSYAQPVWNGKDLGGRTVLLWFEQGFGDTINFVRYAQLVPRRGGKAVVLCQPQLKSLLIQLQTPDVAIVAKGEELPKFDLHLPLMSLPEVFRTERANVPFRERYLSADPNLAAKWAARLHSHAGASGKLRVGIAWAGSPGHRNDAARSIALSGLKPLLRVPGATFFSLQKGEASQQLAALQDEFSIIDWTGELDDFTQTAALIANLDLVIAVDTVVVHLAGAMGKPVWTLIAAEPDFRWLADNRNTCWYTSMRLFRQPKAGDWELVVREAASELGEWAREHAFQQHAALIEVPPYPSDPQLMNALQRAQEFHARNQTAEAEALYRQVLERDPNDAIAMHYLGLIAHRAGQNQQAIELLERSIELQPSATFLKNITGIYRALGRGKEAIDAVDRVLESDPGDAHARFGLALTLAQTGRLAEAVVEYQRAIALHELTLTAPQSPGLAQFRAKLYSSLGATLGDLRRYDESIIACNKAVELDPASAVAHQNRGYAYFCLNDLPHGFEDYEWRWKCEGFTEAWRDFGKPKWDGFDPAGRTILLWYEQGMGDSIHFSRYARLLSQRGGKAILLCQAPVKRLLESLKSDSIQVISNQDPLPTSFDAHLPLMSLAHAFRTTRHTIPFSNGYLRPNDADVAKWAQRIKEHAGSGSRRTLRIGIAWAGSASNANDANRSMMLAALRPLLEIDGARFFSLQKDGAAKQIEQLPDNSIIDWAADLKDFADTAALIANLDLVIAVDTAVVHVAGATGKEAWVMLPYRADFRWAADRERSGWYDSIRLFRQTTAGDWASVIERVADAMRKRIQQPAEPKASHSLPSQYMLLPELENVLRSAHEHHSAGRLAQAELLYRQVLSQHPNHSDALHHLGLIAMQAQHFGPAIELMSRSVALDPSQAFFYKNLATAYRSSGRFEEAIQAIEQARRLAPNDPTPAEELGIVLEKLNRLDESIAAHRDAIRLLDAGLTKAPPALAPKAQMNLGAALIRQEKFEEAMPHLERAIALSPDYALAHMHHAAVLFRRRDLPAAFAEYEWRFRCKGFPTLWRDYPQPAWDGSPLNGKTILLWPEQGLGDLIQFSRFIPQVIERGGKVILQCMPELKRVLQSLKAEMSLVTTQEPVPNFDVHLPLISLPRVLETTADTIPAPQKYLYAEPQLVEQWKQKLQNTGPGLRVGLVWSGSSSFPANHRRSIPIEALLPVADVPGISWHSLQLGEAAKQLPVLAGRMPIVDHSADLRDFADSAALLENLDLLISTDTAIVHLAGALGKETWTLLWTERDFRWLLDDQTMPWYPSVRPFKQTRMGQWGDVVQVVKQELRRRAATTAR
ncbi:MAG TPA: tetratricopeptide repeat protein [Tepidisphaeraceae bacterium]|nr:tetratricopeptide repeat protein [Tepidisphaeraceae bacterium]